MQDLFENDEGEPLFDADIKKLHRDKDEARKLELDRWVRDFKKTLCSTPQGRRVLWWIIHESYMYRPYGSHNAGAYALEGKRELGLDIVSIIGTEAILESLLKVKQENPKEGEGNAPR